MLMFSLAFFGPAFMGHVEYKYDATDAAWYAAFAPIAWCFSFAWVIYKSHFGHEGIVTTRISKSNMSSLICCRFSGENIFLGGFLGDDETIVRYLPYSISNIFLQCWYNAECRTVHIYSNAGMLYTFNLKN